jgi:hypothetical protein
MKSPLSERKKKNQKVHRGRRTLFRKANNLGLNGASVYVIADNTHIPGPLKDEKVILELPNCGVLTNLTFHPFQAIGIAERNKKLLPKFCFHGLCSEGQRILDTLA